MKNKSTKSGNSAIKEEPEFRKLDKLTHLPTGRQASPLSTSLAGRGMTFYENLVLLLYKRPSLYA